MFKQDTMLYDSMPDDASMTMMCMPVCQVPVCHIPDAKEHSDNTLMVYSSLL